MQFCLLNFIQKYVNKYVEKIYFLNGGIMLLLKS